MSARVKHETHEAFKEIAQKYNTTIPRILDSFVVGPPDPALGAFFMPEYQKAFELVSDLLEEGYDVDEILDDIREELL